MSDSISSYVANSPFASFISQQEQDAGLPSGLLGAVGYAESTLGLYGSSGNGGGWGQFTPATGAAYGVDPTNDQSGIQGSASYLSDLYSGAAGVSSATGSWVNSLVAYGTIPSNYQSASLNSGQQNALNIAQQADGGLGSGITGGMNPDTGAPLNPNLTPSSPGLQQQGAKTSQSIPGWVTQLENWVVDKTLTVWVAVLAILLIILAVADLVFGKSPAKVGQIIVKGVKSGVE